MNLRKITLKYMGWCPGIDSAARFVPDRELSRRTQTVILSVLILVILVWLGYLELSIYLSIWAFIIFFFLRLRESAGEVGSNAFRSIEAKRGLGTRCELVDCSHNIDARPSTRASRVGSGKDYAEVEKIEVFEGVCSIESHPEPILDVMDFISYCPEYDGGKFPGVRDVSRKGKTRWDSFLQRNPFWFMDRGGPFKNEVNPLDASKLTTRVHGEWFGWSVSEKSKEEYEKHLDQVEAEAMNKKKRQTKRVKS